MVCVLFSSSFWKRNLGFFLTINRVHRTLSKRCSLSGSTCCNEARLECVPKNPDVATLWVSSPWFSSGSNSVVAYIYIWWRPPASQSPPPPRMGWVQNLRFSYIFMEPAKTHGIYTVLTSSASETVVFAAFCNTTLYTTTLIVLLLQKQQQLLLLLPLLRTTTYYYVLLRTTTYYYVLLRTSYTYYYVLLRTTTQSNAHTYIWQTQYLCLHTQ